MTLPGAAVIVATALFGLTTEVHAQQATNVPDSYTGGRVRPSAHATETTGEIRIDGRLDEAIWQGTPAAADFVQAEPFEGLPATERTEVWIAFDPDNLYIAARLYDSGAAPVVNDIKKDFSDTNQDVFAVILDTFRDRRNGYVFMTNPEGARGDQQVAGEGREVNTSWDAIWNVETRQTAEGWTIEMEIPFRAIRSDPSADQWGINFRRNIRRNNETAYWAPIPRAYALTRLSLAGDLTGLASTAGGRDLRVKPFVLGNRVRETGGDGFSGTADGGVDVKYGLTPSLTLDVTVNPDFAQVEADEQRVNLTQFSLFYQEKREFFLENSGLFYVGDAARNIRVRLTPGRDEDLLLFFSRRIGIDPSGRAIPIRAGARLTGQALGLVVGGLAMRTGGLGDTPANDYAVARVRKNILRASDIGAIYMERRAVNEDGDFNRVYGADAYIRFPGEIDVSAYLVGSETPGLGDGQYAWRWSVNREGNFHHIKFGAMRLGENFNADIGYFRRTGITKYFVDWGVRPRPQWATDLGIREIHPHVTWNYYEDLSGRIAAKRLHSGITAFLSNGGNWQLATNPASERIEVPFRIDSRIDPIPAGVYHWADYQLTGSSDRSRKVSGSFGYTWGGLWTGTQRSGRLNFTLKPSHRFSASAGVTRTSAHLELPDASFVKTYWTLRTNYSFNTNTFVDALVQYDPVTRRFNSNVRFNVIHHPLSDLYIVWNEQRFMTGEGIIPGRGLTIKVTHMLAF